MNAFPRLKLALLAGLGELAKLAARWLHISATDAYDDATERAVVIYVLFSYGCIVHAGVGGDGTSNFARQGQYHSVPAWIHGCG